MQKLVITLAAALLIGAALPAPPASAKVGLGDLIEKVTKKDKKEKKKQDDKAQAEAKRKKTGKVDNFIDKNHDGVDDRRGRKVVRPQPKDTQTTKPKPPRKPETPKPDSAAGKPD